MIIKIITTLFYKDWINDHGRKFGHFINNKWVVPEDRQTYNTKESSGDNVLASTIQGTQEDVNLAVEAAKAAYKSWKDLPAHTRARHLYRYICCKSLLFSSTYNCFINYLLNQSHWENFPSVLRDSSGNS